MFLRSMTDGVDNRPQRLEQFDETLKILTLLWYNFKTHPGA